MHQQELLSSQVTCHNDKLDGKRQTDAQGHQDVKTSPEKVQGHIRKLVHNTCISHLEGAIVLVVSACISTDAHCIA